VGLWTIEINTTCTAVEHSSSTTARLDHFLTHQLFLYLWNGQSSSCYTSPWQYFWGSPKKGRASATNVSVVLSWCGIPSVRADADTLATGHGRPPNGAFRRPEFFLPNSLSTVYYDLYALNPHDDFLNNISLKLVTKMNQLYLNNLKSCSE
jgi:hypothetical protein